MKVLIAEDEPQTRKYLHDILDKEGFEVFEFENGDKAIEGFKKQQPDFLLLDIGLEDIDGFEICRQIRKEGNKTPVMFITARDSTIDKIMGLELGADDYITKPFDIQEVIARIRAVARRCLAENNNDSEELFIMGGITVYPNQLIAEDGEHRIELSLRDVKILSLLKQKQNNVITRDELLDHCWGVHIMPESRTLDWHISQLRKKIEKDPKNPQIIQTVHGVGYQYKDAL